MGAMAAVTAASRDQNIKAIAIDSVPADSDGLLHSTVERRFKAASFATTKLAELGTRLYYFDGCYQREPTCETARRVNDSKVMLLAGFDVQEFQEPTSRLSKCFPSSNQVETKLDLSPSGFSITNASIEQSEAYDQRLIDFFRNSLSTPMVASQ
jgi:hypothetical protein